MAGHVPKPTGSTADDTVFLDTSALIPYVTGREVKGLGEAIRSAATAEASHYVRMEFKSRVIRDLIYLVQLLGQSKDFADAQNRVKNLHREFGQRRKEHCLEVLTRFLKLWESRYPQRKNTDLRRDALEQISSLVRARWLAAVRATPGTIEGCGCLNGKGDVKGRRVASSISFADPIDEGLCSKCPIPDFLQRAIDNHEMTAILRSLSAAQEQSPDDREVRSMFKHLEAVAQDLKRSQDYHVCRKYSDAVIALECPGRSTFLSTDKKHTPHLCTALGKRYQTFPAARPDEDRQARRPSQFGPLVQGTDEARKGDQPSDP